MSDLPWTPEQIFAIKFDEPHRLLVSAAAGSGKTAVLTERIAERSLKGFISPARLLVMTFTELAAKQMKNKIISRFRELHALSDSEGERKHIERLVREFPLAQISTIHAFCNSVLSSHLTEFTDGEGNPLLEPGYRILEGSEEQNLLSEAVESVLSRLYAQLDTLEKSETEGNPISQSPSRMESTKEIREKDTPCFSEAVPRGIPACADEAAPFVLAGDDCTTAQWLRDFKAVSFAYAPGLDDRPLREAVSAMLEQLRNLPRYEKVIAAAYDDFADSVSSFPNGQTYAYWWELFEKTSERARRALGELQYTDHYARMFDQTPGRKKPKHLVDMADATREMERIVTALGTSVDRSEERWNEIVTCGKTLPALELPGFGSRSSANEEVIAKNACLEQFFREVFPLAALISNKINRGSERNKKYISQYPPVFTVSAEEARESMRATLGPVARFLETVLLVDAAFKKARFAKNAILFSDIEHGALAILDKSDIGGIVSQQYDEIYIDEYQDTSSIQDAIIASIDRENVFMVGDVKQSIYRFRYANPQLFSARADASLLCRPDRPAGELSPRHAGFLALLNRNFRSRPGIIDFVNGFFSAFLTKTAGEIEYDDTQALEAARPHAGADKTPRCLREPEVVWEIASHTDAGAAIEEISVAEETEPVSLPTDLPPDIPRSAIKIEAWMAARIIGNLLDAGAKPEAIAILLPTNDYCRIYEDVLLSFGIPVTSRSGKTFPDNLVSRQVEALLSVLDNPRQDNPLLSVMIGPFAPDPFTGEELITIAREDACPAGSASSEDRSGEESAGQRATAFFHDRLRHLCARDSLSPLSGKVRTFNERMDRWRILATELNAGEWLDTVFLESDYPSYIARGPLGASHYAELEQLADWLGASGQAGRPGVRAMLHRLRESLNRPVRLDAEAGASPEGSVHLLTRHSSKGLQWDYVLLGGLNRRDTGNRSEQIISYSEQDGLSSFTIGRHGLAVYNNALNQSFRLSEAKRCRAEAWRLFYVAMTRARERLFLLSTARKKLADMSNIKAILEETDYLTSGLTPSDRRMRAVVPESLATAASNDLELLFSVLAVREPDMAEAVAMADSGTFQFQSLETSVTPWTEVAADVLSRHNGQNLSEADSEVSQDSTGQAASGEAADEIAEQLLAEIPRRMAADTPAKITVTELSRMGDEPRHKPLLSSETSEPPALSLVGSDDSARLGPTALTIPEMSRADIALTMRGREETEVIRGASLGTLMHRVFQFIRLEELAHRTDAEAQQACRAQLRELVRNKIITEEQEKEARAFAGQITAWAKSPLAGRLLKTEQSTGRVYREMPFTMALPSSRLDDSFPPDEVTLIQGMIDLWFIEDDERVVLVDFKTDALPDDTASAEAIVRKRYAAQLKYYAEAIKRATGRGVDDIIVWLIRYAKAVTF